MIIHFTDVPETVLDYEDNKKRFKCPICPSTFSHKFNLPRHMATIHEGKKRTDLEIKEGNVNLKGDLVLI